MKKINVFHTSSKLLLKNLILNEDKTFIVGKVQDKDYKKVNEDDPEIKYISTKWEINAKTKICKCVLDIPEYDFSIGNTYIEGLGLSQPKVKKSFYTFRKDAWHCKLYKWVYGKEPHKVHPTMCPYFWIMVVSLLLFPLVLIVKMFGKGGTKFMESLATYKQRQRERREKLYIQKRDNWVKNIQENWKTFTPQYAKKIIDSTEWGKWHYYLGYNEYRDEIQWEITRIWRNYRDEENKKKVEREHEVWLQKQAKLYTKPKQNKKHVENKVEKKTTYNPNSKTAKLIGILLIVICSVFIIYGLSVITYKTVQLINWVYVGYIILSILGLALLGVLLYLTAIYVILPLWNKILTPFAIYCIWYPIKYCIVKPVFYGIIKPVDNGFKKVLEADYGCVDVFFNKLDIFSTKLAFILTYPFVMLYKGGLYAIEFFRMCKDLIYSMYKKNCPRIDWVEDENK